MTDKLSKPPREGHPVLSGIAALVAVGMVVGLVLGGVAWAGARVLGLGEETASTSEASADASDSLFLPPPEKTEEATGPLITLAPEPGSNKGGGGSEKNEQDNKKKKDKKKETQITLSAGQTAVGQMQQIDLTGVYPGGEGRILQVQRFEGGSWADFDVTASVSNETFSTYVLSGQTGPNRFRMIDTDSGAASNEVTIQVS